MLMAFQVSPGVNVSEVDLTTTTPAVSTSVAAIAGVFNWGPVEFPVLVSNENQLVSVFGKPSDTNYETFFSAANFLSYSSALFVSRAEENAKNAVAGTASSYDILIKNKEQFDSFTTNDNTISFIAKYPGALGNSLKVSQVRSANEYSKSVDLMNSAFNGINTATNIPNAVQTFVAANVGSNEVVVRLGKSDNEPSFPFNAQTAVNPTTDAITLGTHGLAVNDMVTYIVQPGNTALAGLTSGSNYFVVSTTATAIVISASLGGTPIELTPGANETGHSFTKAGTNGLSLPEAAGYLGALANAITLGTNVRLGNATIGYQRLPIKSISSVAQDVNGAQITLVCDDTYKLAANHSSKVLDLFWEYTETTTSAPGASQFSRANPISGVVKNDEISVVVVDAEGKFSGTPGSILEVYENLSRATDARNADGSNIFWKHVINETSKYIVVPTSSSDSDLAGLTVVASNLESKPTTLRFKSGSDGLKEGGTPGVDSISVSRLAAAWDQFRNSESSQVDISLLIAGKPVGLFNSAQLAKYLIENIAEVRKDCVVFISPPKANLQSSQAQTCLDFRNQVGSSSYAFMDSGYKYQYDKYNDTFRWVPLNGDIAGLAARTDNTRDPWYSPAGFNRGTIKNSIKLWWNPDQTSRDLLYKNSINPVVTFQGQGTVLYGDKTLLANPSAFDRINVRRLFIVLEKTIARAAQSSLFEFNDDFTRSQFRNLVEPFLREVQGRRGIYDFRVVCDETNNTGEVVDSNRFVGDIYIKPAKAINFIQLNFVAVRSNVDFSEFVGQF